MKTSEFTCIAKKKSDTLFSITSSIGLNCLIPNKFPLINGINFHVG